MLVTPQSMWLTAILASRRSQQLSQVGNCTKSLGFVWLPDSGKRLTSLLPSMGTSHSYQLFWPLSFPATESGFSSNCQCLHCQFPALSSIAVKHKTCFPFSWLDQENFWCNFCPQYLLIFQATGCDSPHHTQINSKRWSGVQRFYILANSATSDRLLDSHTHFCSHLPVIHKSTFKHRNHQRKTHVFWASERWDVTVGEIWAILTLSCSST